jgi:metal-responsive CopG/Arc/MetJ family transcriptional regulator
MAMVNYSVPDDVRDAFNEAFAGENKSAVVAELMRQAVEERRRRERRARAIGRLLDLRKRTPAVSGAEVLRARRRGRP